MLVPILPFKLLFRLPGQKLPLPHSCKQVQGGFSHYPRTRNTMKPPFFALRAMALGLAAAYCLAPTACQAQTPDEDPPRLIKPVPTLDPAEKNRREALDQYLHGLIELGANRPVEAIGFLDKALELDPKALPPKRALVWAHHQLFRRDEVIRLGAEVLQRDPDDITLALTVAASLTIRGMETEAGDLLEKLLQAEKVQETLSLKIDVLGELANLRRDTRQWKASENALTEVIAMLDRPELTVLGWSPDRLKKWKAEALERVGRLRVEQNNLEGALESYRQARAVDQVESARLGLLLGNVLARQGRQKEALEKLAEYLTTKPSGLDGYELWITLRRQQGQDKRLLDELTAFAAADPVNANLGILLARQRAQYGNWTGAEAACLQAFRTIPSPESARVLIDLWWNQPDKGPASFIAFLDSCVTEPENTQLSGIPAFPGQAAGNQATDKSQARQLSLALQEDPVRLRELLTFATRALSPAGEGASTKPGAVEMNQSPWKPMTLQLLGRWALELRSFSEAVVLHRALLSLRGADRDVRFAGRISFAEVLVQDHRYDEASRVVREALAESKPGQERVQTRLWLAGILSQMKENERALEQVDLAEAEAPEHLLHKTQISRARVVAEAGRPEESLAILAKLREKLLGLEDRRNAALTSFYILDKLKRLAEADKELEALLQIDPNDAQVCNALSYSWSERNMRLDEAERLIRRCLKNEEEEQRQGKRDTGDRTGWSPHPSASYVDTLGWVFYRQGKLDQALRELDRALALPGGDDPEIWEHRGDILNALNRRVEAISSWRRALVQLETIPHHSKASRRNILVEKLRPGEATPSPPKR